ncbi:MAG: type VI secretion system tip protein VgrG [Rhizobacter sp.]
MSTQRRVTIDTPLGSLLQFRKLVGQEHLSQLFILDVDLLSTSKSINPHDLLGQTVTVNVEHEGSKRQLTGVVSRFGMQGMDERKNYHYKMRISPRLWLATKTTDFKIFQNKTVPDVISEVLGKYGYPLEKKLSKAYRSWEYIVQYNESDYNFISRLLSNEGAYYYFKHAPGQNTLVLADDIVGSHTPLPGNSTIPFYPPDQLAGSHESRIYQWELAEEINSGRHFTDDFNFKKPKADLSSLRKMPPGHTHDSGEVYEWPGGYTEYSDGENYARVRLEQQLSPHTSMQGLSNHCGLTPGFTFTLKNYPRDDQNQQYLLVGVAYEFEENSQVSGSSGQGGSMQRFSLVAQPTTRAFNPPKATPKPLALGTQTAWVVGPPGSEIHTDQYGRIKVQFHWDRIGAMDDNSSCWMRVLTPWAGPTFGMIHIPRVGFEVMVGFENSDPDRPVVMGCLYNANNMPPWALPANATQSGIKTRSSKGGASGAGIKNGPGDANIIRFEDKAGGEELWVHAQKDFLSETENDENKWVGQDRRKVIDRDEFSTIHRDRTEIVDRDEDITVHNNRKERVDHNEKISIGDNRTEDVGINESITIGKNRTKKIGRNESDRIGKNWSIKVGVFKTETIGVAYMQNVGVGRMENVGVVYNLNVGAIMSTNVGKNQSTNVGSNQTIDVGADQTTTIAKNRTDSAGENFTETVGKNSSTTVGEVQTITVGKEMAISVGDALEIKCGAATLRMTKDGTVQINGSTINVSGSSAITIASPTTNINPS